jgi:hypothetical protein
VVALFSFVGLLVGIAVFVTTIVGMVRIVTNCGYSGWWVLAYFAPPIIGYIVGLIFLASVSLSGGSGRHVLGLAVGVFVIEAIAVLASWFIFIRFAFADWPLLQQARAKTSSRTPSMHRGGGPGGGQPGFYPGAPPPPPRTPTPTTTATAGPFSGSPATQAAAEPGWYPSGRVGSGEQSYWDGSAWTARRIWRKETWVDLPLEPPGAPEPGARH